MESEWVREKQLPQIKTGKVRENEIHSLYACIKSFHSLGHAYYEQHQKHFIRNDEVSVPALRETYSMPKKQFSSLSNNHICACKIQLEGYHNKLESTVTLVNVERTMSQ